MLNSSAVSAGEAGITECSRLCNKKDDKCVGFGVVAPGKCFLMADVNVTGSKAEAAVTGFCFKNLTDWLDFGAYGAGDMAGTGFYCVSGSDVAGDGADPTGNKDQVVTANTNVCAAACRALPGCQYFVSKPTSCYLKSNLLSGQYGVTRRAARTIA